MQAKTKGVVLRKVAYSGSSAIVTIYTEQYGIVAFLVRGAYGKRTRTSSGRTSATLQPLTQVEITFIHKESRSVQVLDKIETAGKGIAPIERPSKITIALFLAEILLKSLNESAEPRLYKFIETAIEYFAISAFNPDFHLVFMMKLSHYFGFSPAGTISRDTPYFDLLSGQYTHIPSKSIHTLSGEVSLAFSGLAQAGFSSQQNHTTAMRRQLLKAMIEYYQLHLEGMGEIKSLDVLSAVFS